MALTLSVSSFQAPDTPATSACPPRRPSMPTSRATRVTSDANLESCPTMSLVARAVTRKSPRSGAPPTSSGTPWERSPRATAPMTRLTSAVGRITSSTRSLTASTQAAQSPLAPGRVARCRPRPSCPTSSRARRSSTRSRSCIVSTSLSVSAILPGMPTRSIGIRALKSPERADWSTTRSRWRSRSCPSNVVASSMRKSTRAERPLIPLGCRPSSEKRGAVTGDEPTARKSARGAGGAYTGCPPVSPRRYSPPRSSAARWSASAPS